MSTATRPGPVPFTAEDYVARMARVVDEATEAGLDGVIVAPGPDLVVADRLPPDGDHRAADDAGPVPGSPADPARPRARAARRRGGRGRAGSRRSSTGPTGRTRTTWPARLLQPDGRFGISDSAWAMHLLGLQRALPDTHYRALSESLPMLRAVKDANELGRLDDGRRGGGRDVRRDRPAALRRAARDRGRGRPGPAPAGVRARAGRLHRRRLRPQRRQPPPRGRRPGDRAGRRGRARLRRPDVRLRLGHHPHGVGRRAGRRGAHGARDRPRGPAGRRSRRCGPGSRARRSTGSPETVITEAGYGE